MIHFVGQAARLPWLDLLARGPRALQSTPDHGQPAAGPTILDCPVVGLTARIFNMARPPRIPVWLPLDQPVIYFVTWCVQDRRPVLANAEALTAFQNALSRLTRWQLIAAVLMPDHVHALTCPLGREEPVSDFSALVKRWMREELMKTTAGGPPALNSVSIHRRAGRAPYRNRQAAACPTMAMAGGVF